MGILIFIGGCYVIMAVLSNTKKKEKEKTNEN